MDKKIKDNLLHTSIDLESYLNHKALNHKNYKFYSSYDKINTIINNKAVYLSDGTNWNDIIDKNNFNSNKNDFMNFGLCLSYSRSENTAMWMLYSGNNGVMIDYNQNAIRNILDTQSINVGFFDNSKKFKCVKTLEKEYFKIQIIDILYYDYSKANDKDEYYVRRSDEVNREFDKVLIDKLSFCKKTLPWSYENECRLIVSINKKYVSNCDTVEIKFSEDFNFETLLERIYDSPNSKKNKFNESYLKNKINWNLCNNCSRIKSEL